MASLLSRRRSAASVISLCKCGAMRRATVVSARAADRRGLPRRARRGRPASGKSTWAGARTCAGRGRRRPTACAPSSAPASTTSPPAPTRSPCSTSSWRRGCAAASRPSSTPSGSTRAPAAGWRALARAPGVPCVAVAFDTPAAECRRRNAARPQRTGCRPQVLSGQLAAYAEQRRGLDAEGFDAGPAPPSRSRVVARGRRRASPRGRRRRRARRTAGGLRFGLQLSRFDVPGGAGELAAAAARRRRAGRGGRRRLAVGDGPPPADPAAGPRLGGHAESGATLAHLAAATERDRSARWSTRVTYRNVAQLGKIVATLDVLSGGRAVCGLGAGWFEAEHTAYGWPFPPGRERLDLLEDALRLLPLLWGKGAPAFEGHACSTCPRR